MRTRMIVVLDKSRNLFCSLLLRDKKLFIDQLPVNGLVKSLDLATRLRVVCAGCDVLNTKFPEDFGIKIPFIVT